MITKMTGTLTRVLDEEADLRRVGFVAEPAADADHPARAEILDHPRLLTSVLEAQSTLRISPQLYFYILTRHVLKETGIESRSLSDYVASLLESFSDRAGMRSPADGSTEPIQYLSDMLIALRGAGVKVLPTITDGMTTKSSPLQMAQVLDDGDALGLGRPLERRGAGRRGAGRRILDRPRHGARGGRAKQAQQSDPGALV